MTHLTAPSEASQIKDHVASIVRGVCQSLGVVVAESQKAVGIKQFNRANYYTGKTVAFNPLDFAQLLRAQVRQ